MQVFFSGLYPQPASRPPGRLFFGADPGPPAPQNKSRHVYPEAVAAELIRQADNGRPLMMAFDFDGTLTPFVANPDDAHISEQHFNNLKTLIENHSKHFNNKLAILTGRGVDDLLDFFGTNPETGRSRLAGLPVLISGWHGGTLYDAETGQYLVPPDPGPARQIDRLLKKLNNNGFENRYPGIRLENKTYSLALHYSGADAETAEAAIREFEKAVRFRKPLWRLKRLLGLPAFELKAGEKVLELTPTGFDKGAGIRRLAAHSEKSAGQAVHPFFIGDGLTDNDGFRALADQSATTVYVGKPSPAVQARYTIPNTEDTGEIGTRTESEARHRQAVSARNVAATHTIIHLLNRHLAQTRQ